MFISKLSLPRRTFLRGVGATVALPLLEAMVPAATAIAKTAATPRKRFGAVYIPHGAIMDEYRPATEGSGFEFTPILKPLESVKDSVVVSFPPVCSTARRKRVLSFSNQALAAFSGG